MRAFKRPALSIESASPFQSVLPWGHTSIFLERPAEMSIAAESPAISNFRNTQMCQGGF